LILLGALTLLVGGSTASADWIVMEDGSRLETKGPWAESGETLVFTQPNDTLSSVKLADVDLEASRQMSLPPKPAADKQDDSAPPDQKTVFVLTDADVRHPSDLLSDDAESQPRSTADEAEQGEPVQVVTWKDIGGVEDQGVILVGTARNFSESVAAGLSLSATLYDAEGTVLDTRAASLGADSLGPGQSTSFRAEFPGFFAFTATGFRFSFQLLKTNVEPPGPGLGRSEDSN
jgi:hypothetical protein